jgi:hypothetical protein
MAEVCSEVKRSVENSEINAAHKIGGSQYLKKEAIRVSA